MNTQEIFLVGVAIFSVFGVWILWKILKKFLEKKSIFSRAQELEFLQIRIPKQDSKEDRENVGEEFGSAKDFIKIASSMSQLYTALFSLSSSAFWKKKVIGQDFFVVEYFVEGGLVKFMMGFPKGFIGTAMKQIASMYPDCVILPCKRPEIAGDRKFLAGNHLFLGKSFTYPIKKMESMSADPINNIINAFSKVDVNDRAGFQIMLRPEITSWQDSVKDAAQSIQKKGKKSTPWYFFPLTLTWDIIKFFVKGVEEEDKNASADEHDSSGTTQETVKEMEAKASQMGFDTIFRIFAASNISQAEADEAYGDVLSALQPYESPNLNGFSKANYFSKKWLFEHYEKRTFFHPFWVWIFRFWKIKEWKQIFSPDELTGLFHFPSVRYNPSPSIEWQGFKMTPPPVDMPKEGVLLGLNEYRGKITEVRIKPDDRMRHFYLIGKSGTGKSTILEQMIRQDIVNGNGCCVVDPHGDLVEAVLPYVPRHRAEDVIVFNPADLDRPMGVNILEAKTDDQKEFMAQEALAIFIKLYGEEIMGPRLQNYFRNACLTLMSDDEDPATLLDIMRLFTDDAYSKIKQGKVKNASVKAFWDGEYAKSGDREKQEIIPYFAAKFGPFVTNSQIRNIIGQGKSGFDFREVMDQKKILLVNLSKGKLGDLNAQLLGMIFVSKIQMAAMSRANIPQSERKDFYLYVDEFQNFVTESFASILSEARKYRLGLIVAHQYISQITKMQGGGKGSHEDHTIKDAVFGNVGSMMCFKIGAQDAEAMVKEFQPVFSETDLINIANYHAFIKLNINNTTSRGFVMKTIYDTSLADNEAAEAYKQLSRLQYARDRSFVEREIKRKLIGTSGNVLPGMEQAFAKPIF